MSEGPTRFAVLLGAMKAGTGSFFEYITQHPEICGGAEREIDFFVDEDRWSRGLGYYRSFWDWDPDTHVWAFEKSPAYTRRPRFPNAAARMDRLRDRHDLEFRFLFIARDPVERLDSHVTHDAAKGRLSRDEEEPGLAPQRLATSMYARQLEPYVDRFGSEDLMVLNFEELKEDPLAMMEEAAEFLEIDPSFEFDRVDPDRHRTDALRTKRTPLTVLEDHGLASALGTVLPEAVRSRAVDLLRPELGERKELTETEREFAVHALEADLRRLRREHGVDVSRWGYDVDGTPAGEMGSATEPGAR